MECDWDKDEMGRTSLNKNTKNMSCLNQRVDGIDQGRRLININRLAEHASVQCVEVV